MPDPYRVIITPRAARDLEQIHQYISLDSPLNADGMARKILDAIEPFKNFPNRMIVITDSPKLREPVRSLLHIRHGARKPPRNLK